MYCYCDGATAVAGGEGGGAGRDGEGEGLTAGLTFLIVSLMVCFMARGTVSILSHSGLPVAVSST